MDFETDAMTQTVAEVGGELVPSQDISCELVDGLSTLTRTECSQCCLLGLEHRVVHAPEFARNLTERHRAGHVSVIPANHCPEIERDELAERERSL